MQHSQGPFKVAGQSEGGRYIKITSASGRTVARVPFNTENEVEAGIITDAGDAALLAASPTMLDALYTLESLINSFYVATMTNAKSRDENRSLKFAAIKFLEEIFATIRADGVAVPPVTGRSIALLEALEELLVVTDDPETRKDTRGSRTDRAFKAARAAVAAARLGVAG